MQYFVTGAAGFIGKRRVKKRLARKGSRVYFLTRQGSRDKVPALFHNWGCSKMLERAEDCADQDLPERAGPGAERGARPDRPRDRAYAGAYRDQGRHRGPVAACYCRTWP